MARSQNLRLGLIWVLFLSMKQLKELLDITVITTDFEAMGRTAANCICSGEVKEISIPFI
jgi:hypothetical protein